MSFRMTALTLYRKSAITESAAVLDPAGRMALA